MLALKELIPHFLMAHAFGVRYELPLPLWLFVLGGAGVVLLSAAFVLPRPVLSEEPKLNDTTRPVRMRWAPFVVSYLAFVGLVICGLVGSQEVAENMLPTMFWLVIWIAVPLSCGLLGDWTRPWNVFAGVAHLLDTPGLRKALMLRDKPMTWPAWLGWWPAAALYFLVACGELIFSQTATTPHVIANDLAVYFVLSGVMGLVFGEAWLQKGELFTVLFATWGRLGFWRFGEPGRSGFGGGLGVNFEPSASRITFVLLLLASVAFDGLLSTPFWNNLIIGLSTAQVSNFTVHAIFVGAFLGLIGLFWLAFGLFAVAVNSAGTLSRRPLAAFAALLPSLVPISFGYLFAHNFEYLSINGQLLLPLIGNPTGLDSWPINLPYPFNDSYELNTHIISGATYWYVALAVVVLAHIVALVISHRDMGTMTRSKAKAKLAEYPWVGAMVLYTMLSLWLLAQPLVKEKGGQDGYAPTGAQIQAVSVSARPVENG